MITRERAAITIVSVNRIARTLEYWIDLNTDTFVSVLRDDILRLETLAKDIYEYILSNPSENLFQLIDSIPDTTNVSSYLKRKKKELPKDIVKALKQYIKNLNLVTIYVDVARTNLQGEDYALPAELKSDEAHELLHLAVQNGLLTVNYKVQPGIKIHQVRLLAYAFIQKLSLKRGAWSTLTRLWYGREVRVGHQYLPAYSSEDVQKVVRLFPTIDFSPCWNHDRNVVFNGSYLKDRKQSLYDALRDNGFIEGRTTFKQFSAIFGDSNLVKKVNWIAKQIDLVYFINLAFHNTHDLLMYRTCHCFMVNGNCPNVGSMRSGFNQIVSTGLLKTYNPLLYDIAKSFSESKLYIG